MSTTTFAEAFIAIGFAASSLFGVSDTTQPAAQGDVAGCDGRADGESHRAMHGPMMRDPDMRAMHGQMMRDPQMRDMHRDHMGSTGGMGHMPADPAQPSN